MKAALCIGGERPERDLFLELIRASDFIAAADSGYDPLHEAGIEPDLVLGDMDSTRYLRSIESLPEGKIELYDREKDETDTEIGLRRLRELGAECVTIIGGGGGRLDHLLGLTVLFDRDLRPDQWYTRGDRVVSIDERKTFPGMSGENVSVFPSGEGRVRIESRGLKWPLGGLVWKRGDAGISNVVTDDPMVLEPLEGRAILVYSL